MIHKRPVRQLLALSVFLVVSVVSAHAQGLSLELRNTSLKEALTTIEKESGYIFLYNAKSVDLNQQVSCSVRHASLDEVMKSILPAGLTYEVKNRQVVIYGVADERGTPTDVKRVAERREATISGRVTDHAGEPLVGVSIVEKGTYNGTVSDADGGFTLQLENAANAVLTFSYLGFNPLEYSVGAQTSGITIVLEEDTVMLNDVVVIGYGKQRKESVTAAISTIAMDDLVQTPQANISNMLVGRMPGLIATQRSGAPGEDFSDLYIRGVSTFTDNSSPLIMVDGVERSNFNGIDPNEIESLSILKDASATAVYGVKGANGVILITTKKGTIGAPKISYSCNFAIQQSTKLPSYLNSAQYATLYNEAGENDARVTGSEYIPRFTDKDIELYANGFDPILHPNTDWIGSFIKNISTRTQHNVNISGGIEKVQYFISGSYYDQTGIYKNTKIDSDHDVNPRDTRYNFRSNFDFQITRDFTAQLQLAAQIETVVSPSGGNSSIWEAISFANPLSSPGLVDGKIVKIENGVGSVNPWQVLLSNGYRKMSSNNLNSSLRLDYDLSHLVTKGLSVHGRVAYDSYYYSSRRYSKSFPYYLASRDVEDPDYIHLVPQSEESVWSVSNSWSKNRKVYLEAGIDYDRTFGDHKVTALLLYNQSKYWSPSLAYYVPNAYQGLVGRLTYEYDSRYLFEFDMGYNGTENFAKGKRFGFFPAVSAGWILSEEPWIPDNDILTYMKIRASYGEVGNDQIGGERFLYPPLIVRSGRRHGGQPLQFRDLDESQQLAGHHRKQDRQSRPYVGTRPEDQRRHRLQHVQEQALGPVRLVLRVPRQHPGQPLDQPRHHRSQPPGLQPRLDEEHRLRGRRDVARPDRKGQLLGPLQLVVRTQYGPLQGRGRKGVPLPDGDRTPLRTVLRTDLRRVLQHLGGDQRLGPPRQRLERQQPPARRLPLRRRQQGRKDRQLRHGARRILQHPGDHLRHLVRGFVEGHRLLGPLPGRRQRLDQVLRTFAVALLQE